MVITGVIIPSEIPSFFKILFRNVKQFLSHGKKRRQKQQKKKIKKKNQT